MIKTRMHIKRESFWDLHDPEFEAYHAIEDVKDTNKEFGDIYSINKYGKPRVMFTDKQAQDYLKALIQLEKISSPTSKIVYFVDESYLVRGLGILSRETRNDSNNRCLSIVEAPYASEKWFISSPYDIYQSYVEYFVRRGRKLPGSEMKDLNTKL